MTSSCNTSKQEIVWEDGERKQLMERISKAEVIVLGEIVEISPAEISNIVSEHDPNWHAATLRVEKNLKSSPGINILEIGFMFPASRDSMWYMHPKFNVGDRGIFFLRSGAIRGPRPIVMNWAPNPKDFQPETKFQKVKFLLTE